MIQHSFPTRRSSDLLFVGNSRRSRRAIVDDLSPVIHDLAVYGKGWTSDLIDPLHVRGELIPNEQLHRYYASARIVLNDHWPDMRAQGFLSNRLYDALASGAFVISDAVVGIEQEFDDAVVTYTEPDELRRLADQYLADGAARRAKAERGRRAVLGRHTFAHRVDRMLEVVAEVEPLRPHGIERWRDFAAWLARFERRRSGPFRAG